VSIIKEHSTVISGTTYITKTFSPTEGLVLLPNLISLIGQDILKLLVGTSDEERKELFKSPDVISGMVAGIAANAAQSEDGFLVLKRLLKHVSSDKVRIGEATVSGSVYEHFDTHFHGRLLHLLEVAIWVATVCFIDP